MDDDRKRKVAAATAIATALAIPMEGIRQVAYYDPPGILTVCEGHTGADVLKNKVYSLKECSQFMTDDMRKAIAIVERCVPGLPVEVLAAVGDATFNIGSTIACKPSKSTVARMLKAGRLVEACNALLAWDKARIAGVLVALPGLTKRRKAERDLCMQGATA